MKRHEKIYKSWRWKLFAAMLAAMTYQSQAGSISAMQKQSGGSVMIFAMACINGNKGNLAASTDSRNAIETYGCASKLSKGLIFIRWDDGKSSVFSAAAFTAQQTISDELDQN